MGRLGESAGHSWHGILWPHYYPIMADLYPGHRAHFIGQEHAHFDHWWCFRRMAELKAKCSRCGAEILEATAKRTGGVCVPCTRPRNQPAEPVFVTYDIDELLRETDSLLVVDRLTGILSQPGHYLREHEVSFLYAQYAKMKILGNGLGCWFDCMFGAGIREAHRGLVEIGAIKSASVLSRALAAFPGGVPPTDAEHYRQALDAFDEEKHAFLNELGREFENSDEDLDELSFRYLQDHRELFRKAKQQPAENLRQAEAYGINGCIMAQQ